MSTGCWCLCKFGKSDLPITQKRELDPCLSQIFGSQKGTELQALQCSQCLAWIGHTDYHGDVRDGIPEGGDCTAEVIKIFAFELQFKHEPASKHLKDGQHGRTAVAQLFQKQQLLKK